MNIPESDYHFFLDVGAVKRYRAGEYVFTRGDAATKIYLVTSGRVLVSTTLIDGRTLTFDVLKKGQLFGDGAFSDHYLREVDISAVTDVELIECETEKLIPVLSTNETLLLLLLRHMTELSNGMVHQVLRLARYTSRQKVADQILVNAGVTGSMPYTHSDIANCLGLNRVTVSRIMQALRAEGLIDYSYGRVTILDHSGLESLLDDLA